MQRLSVYTQRNVTMQIVVHILCKSESERGRMKYFILLSMLTACNTKTAGKSTCYTLCQELVQTCDYDAFPDFNSCEEGCVYYEEEGADVSAQLECIQAAECDEFAVIECEHSHGVESAE